MANRRLSRDLRRRRLALGASLEDVAVAIGVRRSTLMRWERRTPRKAYVIAAWESALSQIEKEKELG